MKKLLTIVMCAVFAMTVAAQDDPNIPKKLEKDPEAKKVLDQLSEKHRAYATLRAKFALTHENKTEKINETRNGTIFIKGDKYKLFLEGTGTEIMYDGKTQASFLVTRQNGEVYEEVTYTTPDPEDKSVLTPANIFSFYETGFYYTRLKDEEYKGKQLIVIEMVPEKRDIKLARVRLKIDKAKNEIYSVRSQQKDGNNYTIVVTEVTPNVTINDKMFVFDTKAHPNAEIIDNRE